MDQATHNKIVSFIWGIADDVLRDVYTRGKYRDVILPFTVLRRLDAVLEPTKKAVLDMKAMLDEQEIVNQDEALRAAAQQAFYNTSPFTLRDLKNVCSMLEDGDPRTGRELNPRRLLVALCAELDEHFRAEEADSYFGVVVTEHPELASDISALEREHATLLRAVETLAGLAADSARWPQLPEPTRQLVRQLERHEGAESKLLRHFFFSQTDGG